VLLLLSLSQPCYELAGEGIGDGIRSIGSGQTVTNREYLGSSYLSACSCSTGYLQTNIQACPSSFMSSDNPLLISRIQRLLSHLLDILLLLGRRRIGVLLESLLHTAILSSALSS
jgi:hypothetical protein